MKILRSAIIVVALLLVPTYAFSAGLGWMRISLIEGDVQVKTADAGDWGPASINGPLMEGDQVWVPQGSRVELQLNSGSFVRLDQNSALQILSLDKDTSQFYLSQGHVYVYFNAPSGSAIQIDTPDASTRAFDNAIFRIDMSEEYQYTDVAVYKGYVETENQVGRTRIDAGQMLSVGQNTNGEVAPMGPTDEWEAWNKKRNDRMFARRGVSSQYLPAELSAYSYDFDSGGRWVDVPDYGHCWTPTVTVGVGWAPYRLGRWAWIGGDYVWISYDPWGWAPYHYGRWAFVVNVGWCWVPPIAGDVYWSPGYVGWVRTADYVGWVPLAPGEIYYGRGHYGRNSVNITNVNINQVNITNVYKNVYVNNGATVVSRNTFATASPKIVNVTQAVVQQRIFTKNNISVGTPAIKPTKASYFMSSKKISAAKLPPQPVRNLRVTQLKQSRPFIKDPNKSVMNPGATAQKLPVNKATVRRTPGKGKPTIQTLQPAAPGKAVLPGGLTPRKEIKPLEKKEVAPTGGLAPKKEFKPMEKKVVPETVTPPRKEFKPMEKKVVPETVTPPRKEFKPMEKKVVPETVTPPRKEFKPMEKKVVPETVTPPRKEFKPMEKKVVPGTVTPPKKEFKPMEKKVVPGTVTPPKKEFKPVEKKPESVAPKGEKPQIKEKSPVKPEGKPEGSQKEEIK